MLRSQPEQGQSPDSAVGVTSIEMQSLSGATLPVADPHGCLAVRTERERYLVGYGGLTAMKNSCALQKLHGDELAVLLGLVVGQVNECAGG